MLYGTLLIKWAVQNLHFSCYFLLNVVDSMIIAKLEQGKVLACYFLLNVVPFLPIILAIPESELTCYFLLNVVLDSKTRGDNKVGSYHLLFSFECCMVMLALTICRKNVVQLAIFF